MSTPSPTRAARAEQHIRMLAELADLTMVLCRVASLRACEQLDPAPPPSPQLAPEPEPAGEPAEDPAGDLAEDPAGDPAEDTAEPPRQNPHGHVRKDIAQDAVLAFARLSRALRQTIALETRIASDREAAGRSTGTADPHVIWRPLAPLPHEIAKAHLADAVLTAANEAPAARRHPGTLLRHIDERLDADDIADAIDDDEDLAVIVAKVCQDLGIAFDPDDHPGDLQLPLRAAIDASRNRARASRSLRYRLEPRGPAGPAVIEDDPFDAEDEPDPPSRPPRAFDA